MPKNSTFLPIGPWLPDQPDFNNPGSDQVNNLVPRTETSYGPMPSPQVYSGAIGNRCQGAVGYSDPNGNVTLFAGDSSKLYRLRGGTLTWADVSIGGGYSTPATQQWKFEYYNGIVLATNFADAIQTFTLGSSTQFANLSSGAPKAKYMAFVRNFLVVANTDDGSDGLQPQRVWWSALGDPTNWPTPGGISAAQVQSSFNDLYGNTGFIQGIVGNLGGADAAVFMQRGVWRMNYAGPPQVFDFFPAQGVRGCCAPGSIVHYGNLVYYLGEDGFYVFDGASSQQIGSNKFDKFFFDDLDGSHVDRVVGTVDPVNKFVIWAYPGADNVNGNPNRLLIYNTVVDRASQAKITLETIAQLYSVGYTLDDLTSLGYTLDTLPAPLDSPIWQGGNILLGTFDTDHKLNFLTGPSLEGRAATTETQLFPGRRARITNTRPIVDGGTPSVLIKHRERLTDSPVATGEVVINALGYSPIRASGRYVRGLIHMPAGSDFTHIQGVEVEASQAGIR